VAIATLRDFLKTLEDQGQLLGISEEMQLEQDLGAAAPVVSNVGNKRARLVERSRFYTRDAENHRSQRSDSDNPRKPFS
jgi:3-polyprenyl-4-hydroxybenzoate decarboxylase